MPCVVRRKSAHTGQVIYHLKLTGQVARKVLRIGRLARNALHQRLRLVDCAERIHVLAQPIQDESRITGRQPLIEVRKCPA